MPSRQRDAGLYSNYWLDTPFFVLQTTMPGSSASMLTRNSSRSSTLGGAGNGGGSKGGNGGGSGDGPDSPIPPPEEDDVQNKERRPSVDVGGGGLGLGISLNGLKASVSPRSPVQGVGGKSRCFCFGTLL